MAGEFVEAGEYISTGSALSVRGFIKAKEFIKTRGSIRSVGFVKTDGFIEAGSIEAKAIIEAKEYIKVFGYVFSFQFAVEAKSISTRRLPFGRRYWAEMPPLKKWRKQILSDMPWEDLRALPTKAEARKICAWGGWHWLLKAHLEMFFGLRDKIIPPAHE